MRLQLLILIIFISHMAYSQSDFNLISIRKQADSIRINTKIHGPHTDGGVYDTISGDWIGAKSSTYGQVSDSTYYVSYEYNYKDYNLYQIKYVMNGSPIMFIQKKYISNNLVYTIEYYIADDQIISKIKSGVISETEVLEIDSFVINNVINKLPPTASISHPGVGGMR